MPTDGAQVIRYRRPPLKDYQLKAIFCPERFAHIEASPKSGKTYGCLLWLAEQAFLTRKRHANFSWLAPVYKQAKIAYRRMRRYIPAALREPSDTELTLKLPNTATINFFSGEQPDNIYGDDDEAQVLDEASRTREEAHHAMISRLSKTGGPQRIIGNVKGRKNWAYRLARKAEAGEAGMHYARITWADAIRAGIVSQAAIDGARQMLPEAVYKEMAEAIPNDDGGNPFGLAHIKNCVEACGGVVVISPAVCYGVDLAKSIDFTWITGLNAAGEICYSERFQKPWGETKTRIRDVCGETPTLVDSTGVGDPVLEGIQRGEGEGLETQRNNFEGFLFSQKSKQQIIEGLTVAVQQQETTVLDGAHRLEMESFEYEYTRTGVLYRTPAGCHDDGVYSHALAWAKYRGIGSRHPVSTWGGTVVGGPEWA